MNLLGSEIANGKSIPISVILDIVEDLDVLNPLYLKVHLDWKLKDCDEVAESCPVLDPRSQGLIQEKNLISEKRKVPTIFFQTGNQKITN